jgi:hypothetical protein
VSEQTQNLQQQTQDQSLQQAQDFFAGSMGRIKGRMQSDSAQLESFMQQLPEDSQAQIQEMTDSYTQFGDSIDQAPRMPGCQDVMEEEAQEARQTADEATGQGQDPVQQATDQVQDVAAAAPSRCKTRSAGP